MRIFILAISAAAFLLTGGASKFRDYTGPKVTQILIDKSKRRMFLLSGKKVLKSYRVKLGFNPEGDKKIIGDGRTPEGLYRINRRNPESRYHLSLGISYPNTLDLAEANALGEDPGGDIFIHGGPIKKEDRRKRDWTAGCISVTDRQMEAIYAMVEDGTLIFIKP